MLKPCGWLQQGKVRCVSWVLKPAPNTITHGQHIGACVSVAHVTPCRQRDAIVTQTIDCPSPSI